MRTAMLTYQGFRKTRRHAASLAQRTEEVDNNEPNSPPINDALQPDRADDGDQQTDRRMELIVQPKNAQPYKQGKQHVQRPLEHKVVRHLGYQREDAQPHRIRPHIRSVSISFHKKECHDGKRNPANSVQREIELRWQHTAEYIRHMIASHGDDSSDLQLESGYIERMFHVKHYTQPMRQNEGGCCAALRIGIRLVNNGLGHGLLLIESCVYIRFLPREIGENKSTKTDRIDIKW